MTAQTVWTVASLLGQAVLDASEQVMARRVTGIAADSRAVAPGDVFFARAGARTHGLRHARAAVSAGAVAVVAEHPREPSAGGAGDRAAPAARGTPALPLVTVRDLAACLGRSASRFFGCPSCALRLLGVTGTNGKTSVTHYIAESASRLAGPCGLLGTLGQGLYGALEPAALTTPDAIGLQGALAGFVRAGAPTAVMEVSSHALAQGRVEGSRFHCAVFTNLTRDHLDYHRSQGAYRAAKRRLLEWPDLAWAVVNADDRFGRQILAELDLPTVAFSLGGRAADAVSARPGLGWLHGRVVRCSPDAFTLELASDWGEGRIESRLRGRFNAQNLLAALGGLLSLEVGLEEAARALAGVHPPPGRMEPVRLDSGAGLPSVVVDYAHTPRALAAALQALKPASGRLWCVFGCGGDRDRGKRAQMARAAAAHADQVVVTSDNPRAEPPERIIEEILAGFPPGRAVRVQADRRQAIRETILAAGARDVVLIAGKGHEPVQWVGTVAVPLDDRVEARCALQERAR